MWEKLKEVQLAKKMLNTYNEVKICSLTYILSNYSWLTRLQVYIYTQKNRNIIVIM